MRLFGTFIWPHRPFRGRGHVIQLVEHAIDDLQLSKKELPAFFPEVLLISLSRVR